MCVFNVFSGEWGINRIERMEEEMVVETIVNLLQGEMRRDQKNMFLYTFLKFYLTCFLFFADFRLTLNCFTVIRINRHPESSEHHVQQSSADYVKHLLFFC